MTIVFAAHVACEAPTANHRAFAMRSGKSFRHETAPKCSVVKPILLSNFEGADYVGTAFDRGTMRQFRIGVSSAGDTYVC